MGGRAPEDPGVRIVESNEDVLLYSHGPHPRRGEDRLARRPERPDHARLHRTRAVRRPDVAATASRNDTIVVFYGDKNNWWACYALWVFKLFGHTKTRSASTAAALNGCRKAGPRPKMCRLSRQPTTMRRPDATTRSAPSATTCSAHAAGLPLVDVRSPGEYTRRAHPHARLPAGRRAARRPHPGRRERPLGQGRQPEDGTFKTADELRELYEPSRASKPSDNIIAYCRIGERSSHTWFVLKYLLGYHERAQLRRLVDRVGQPGAACRSSDERLKKKEEGRYRIANRGLSSEDCHADIFIVVRAQNLPTFILTLPSYRGPVWTDRRRLTSSWIITRTHATTVRCRRDRGAEGRQSGLRRHRDLLPEGRP